MEIKPGKFVVLTYELYAGAGEPEETLMMRATDEMPDQFVYGVDQNILPSMLQRLDGLKEGDKFDFVLTCDEAFGERNEEHVIAEVKNDQHTEQKVASNDTTVSKEPADIQQTSETDKEVKISLDHKANNHHQLSENTSEVQEEPVQDMPQPASDNTELPDEHLHHASTAANDNPDDYQPPSRMEEFIVKLANYHRVKGDTLSCAPDKNDPTVICTAYVFKDTNETDLFRQLLLAACWYDDKTPGYLLNCSQQQFFFFLKDMRIGLKYLWIAERVKDKILLYTTRSPLDTEVSSEYFIEYRDKISNTSNYLKSKEL